MKHIDIKEVFKEFDNHFNIEGNSKVVFSGKYGTGKSYFLKKYFEDTRVNAEYYPIIISPVNYVVSSNEDIFDLIKIDIIKKLYLGAKLDLGKVGPNISIYKKIVEYAKKHPLQIVKNISSSLSKISLTAEVLSKTSEAVISLLNDFDKFENKVNETNKSQEEELKKFANDFTENKNTYVEYSVITQIIAAQLKLITEEDNKKNVLIVEDFDRLDPAHIFRILNILSAHDFEGTVGNKFGFDRIILVCDLDNIEHIYKHFYGVDTDFTGYIDKFYSFEPFYFDNRQAIAYHLKDILKVSLSEGALNCLVEILNSLIAGKILSLRKILQTILIEYKKEEDFILFTIPSNELMGIRQRIGQIVGQPEILFNKSNLEILIIFRILKNIFGNYDKLQTGLLEATKSDYSFRPQNYKDIYATLALPIHFINQRKDYKTMLFKEHSQNDFNYPEVNINGQQYRLIYKWNVQNSYQGKESFFNELQIIPIGNSGSSQSMGANYLFNQLNALVTRFRVEKLLI